MPLFISHWGIFLGCCCFKNITNVPDSKVYNAGVIIDSKLSCHDFQVYYLMNDYERE